MTTTVNISLPQSLYADAKRIVAERRYTSISELFRDALRQILYPRLTENGFTQEFEEKALRASKEPLEDSVEWDGVTPFTEFVLSHPPKKRGSVK